MNRTYVDELKLARDGTLYYGCDEDYEIQGLWPRVVACGLDGDGWAWQTLAYWPGDPGSVVYGIKLPPESTVPPRSEAPQRTPEGGA